MSQLKTLPSLLINKIAAGEVIDRPASVVKELIENALDSGASQIEVTVAEGGKKFIRLTDNGMGLSQADLPLVFLSHTTSKISTEDDLTGIRTFGFRGEALASLGAVSQARLISKLKNQPGQAGLPAGQAGAPEAYVIEMKGGQLGPCQPAAAPEGTTVEINNLFFNTPARRKFLKSNAVEMGHVTEMVTRFAIAHPNVQFRLINNKKHVLDLLPVTDVKERLRHFFGDDLVNQLLFVEEGDVQAYISNPILTKPTTRWQFFFLNQRFIRDRMIARAVRQAYAELIPNGRYPAVFLFIKTPPEEYDVNVHPTKLEVRFRHAWQVHDEILSLIRKKLLASDFVPQAPIGSAPEIASFGLPAGQAGQPIGARQALVDFFANRPPEMFPSSLPGGSGAPPIQASPGTIFTRPGPVTQTETANAGPDQIGAGQSVRFSAFQIHQSYIISEVPDGVLIIDQHALHERILTHKFKEQMRAANVYRQKLLVPVLVELEPKEYDLLSEIRPYLEKLGLEVAEFGQQTISLQAIPQILTNANLPELIHELFNNFSSDEFKNRSASKKSKSECEIADDQVTGEEFDPLLDDLINLLACKAAVKAGDALAPEEIQALLKQHAAPAYTTTCPHGRPAVFKLTLDELKKYFQRK